MQIGHDPVFVDLPRGPNLKLVWTRRRSHKSGGAGEALGRKRAERFRVHFRQPIGLLNLAGLALAAYGAGRRRVLQEQGRKWDDPGRAGADSGPPGVLQ